MDTDIFHSRPQALQDQSNAPENTPSKTACHSNVIMTQSLAPDSTPVYEYILSAAVENLDNDVILVLQDSGPEHEAKLTAITWRYLITAAHSRAAELVSLTGASPRHLGDAPFSVGLLAQSGYPYLVTWLALLVLRWTVVLISPQNSSEAVLHLLKSANATYLLLDKAFETRYKDLPLESTKLAVLPDFKLENLQLENPTQVEALLRHIALVKQGVNVDALRKEARNICTYMHTSGSTGHPKVIAWSHDFINSKTKQNADEYPHGKGRVMYTPFPIYHAAGILMCLDVIAGYGGINTLVEPNLVASPDSVLRHIRILKDRKPDIFVVPSLLEDVVDTLGIEEALEYLRIPNTVFHGGAPLRRDVGDKLAHGGVRLVTVAGTTETGTVGRLVYDSAIEPSDWQYVKLVEGYTLNFTPVNAEHPDQGYTLVVSPKIMAPPIINHEDPHGFLASDLWMRHPDPSKSHLWKMAGRLDDIIVLSNGEKANGKQLETLLCSSPYVSQAVVFGAGRFLCGVILRPSAKYVLPVDDEGAKQAYLSQVWLYIDTHVNKTVPRHSRLLQPLVLVEDPAHPFQYSDKGTVKKQTTLALYHEQIEQAYQTVEQGQSPSVTNPPSPSFDNVTVFTGLVRSQVSECLERTIGDDDDFFNAGLDSLLAVKLRFSIISALKEANVSEVVPHNVIYVHPTTTSLAHYLWSLIDVSHKAYKSANVSSTHCNEAATATMIEETVARLTSSFPDRTQTCVHDQEGEVYVVTGTTGSLGSAFLSLLLQQPQDQIRKVYCLNRKSSKAMTMRRHEISFEERGLDFGSLKDAVENGRAVLVETDVTKKRIGISVELFAEMAAQATHIVHNAWPVTFTYHFQSFIPHLDGLRTLIDLALASPRSVPPHFTFISSIAVASRLPTPSNDAVIPELPLTSVSHVVQHGYALSKYAAEQILEEATSATPLRASIVRSGQIAGSLSTGAWNSNEYMPGILRACVRSGKVPEDLFSVPLRWLPLEHASKVVYAITQAHGSSSSASLTIYGFENTRPVEWSSIVSSLFTLYPALQKVPTLEWFHSVRALQEGKEGIIDSALLDYIEDFMWRKPMPRLATANVEAISPEVADLVDFDFATNEAVVEKYISYAVHA